MSSSVEVLNSGLVSKPRDLIRRYASLYLRIALGVGFLTSVTDRLGLWGPPGRRNVAWGNLERFTDYTATLNPWAPRAIVPAIVWTVTVAEIILGIALLLGFATRRVAVWSGALLLLFGFGMTIGTGLKSALNASVFSASAAAFALSTMEHFPWSVDELVGP
jgi:uncharacterized membrane protein YphA (DoxX/SURF4 family)